MRGIKREVPELEGLDKTERKRRLAQMRRAERRRPIAERLAENMAALPPAVVPLATMLGAYRPDEVNWDYDPALCAEILDKVASGATLSSVLSDPRMPPVTTWHRWVLANKELREAWLAARRLKAGALFDRALDIAETLQQTKYTAGDASKVNALKTAIDTYKWSAGKLDPQAYGERAGEKPQVAIQINTGLNLGRPEVVQDGDGMFNYTIKAVLPAPSPSDEITPVQSGPKRRREVEDRPQ